LETISLWHPFSNVKAIDNTARASRLGFLISRAVQTELFSLCPPRSTSTQSQQNHGGDLQTFPAFANKEGTKGCFDNPSAAFDRCGLPKDQWLSTDLKKHGLKVHTTAKMSGGSPLCLF
jgi:hypothetical protein